MTLRSTLKRTVYRTITTLYGDQDKLVTLPVLSGPAKGLRIRADLIKREEAYFLGKYERNFLDQVLPYIKPGWVVWDCGTYIGYYTIIFARSVGPTGRVVAIELDRANLTRTRENAAINRLSNIEFVNAAIGAPLGEVEFIKDDGTNSHLPGTYVGAHEMKAVWETRDKAKSRNRVECISLDQAYFDRGLAKPNLIKIDIDGAEKDALQHAAKLFEQVRPLLLLELHNPECDLAAWEFSRRFNYELMSLDLEKIVTTASEVHGTVLCRPLDVR